MLHTNTYVGLEVENMGAWSPHMTLLYLGDIDDERFKFVQETIRLWYSSYDFPLHLKFYANRERIKLFGYSNVPVVTTSKVERLVHLRDFLKEHGIEASNSFSWNPHVTIKLKHGKTISIPNIIRLHNMYIESEEAGRQYILPT